MQGINRVVIPVDRSEEAKLAVDQGSTLAKLLGIDVAIISIDDSNQFIASAALEKKLRSEHEVVLDHYRKVVELKNVKVITEIIVGDAPAREIIKYVNDNDLVVMVTHARKGMDRFILGSVSEEVLHCVNCPIMIIKPQIKKVEALL
ncbi:MAG: universal stress protein [Candidatus Thermoplasmatota archaeon]|nr:universal stress protein [Candidatus Thermoplasmatota archaeon]MBU1940873.1 universal stress protein [Candidatus Thermoplasmatota archaeon]